MKFPSLGFVTLAALVTVAPSASAQITYLQNDSWTGGAVSCHTGVGLDESIAAKLTAAPGQYPYTIDRIRVFGCGGGQNPYVVLIYQDDGSGVNPGPLIWQSQNAYLLSGANTFNDILMSDEPVPPPPITSGTIRVTLYNILDFGGIGFGADVNGIIPQRNFFRSATGVWSFAENQSVTGDWILRVGILNPGSPCLTQTVVVVPDGRLTTKTLGAGAEAWFGASLQIGNSYSAEFKKTSGDSIPLGTLTPFSGDDGCSGTSTMTYRETASIDPGSGAASRRISFTAAGTSTFFRARLDNGAGPSMPISFSWSDTTLFSPAWSTNGSYDTYYSFQNTTGAAMGGTLTLLDASGAVLSTFGVSIPPGQTMSVNTASLAVSRNRTGTAKLSHDGPPGAILAEAVIANFSISPAFVQPVKFQAVRDGR